MKVTNESMRLYAITDRSWLNGRPFVPAVYGGEAEGAKLLFAKLKAELVDTMTMCGAHTLAEITREKVYIEK